MQRSLVDHDLAEYGAEQPRPPIGDSPGFDVHVSANQLTRALNVQVWLEQGLVEARNETASSVGIVCQVRSATRFRIDVDDQFVEVLRVISVFRRPSFD
jgi:hypothetical protein